MSAASCPASPKWFKPEDLIGKKLGIVCNLAPRPMMKGKYVSEGMIFAADTTDGGCSIPFYSDDTPRGCPHPLSDGKHDTFPRRTAG